MISDTDFRFHGGRPSLNFVATLGMRWRPEPVERLREPADLPRWSREAGLIDFTFDATTTDLREARELREAIHALLLGRPRQKRAGLALVNQWAARTPPPIQLRDGRTVISTMDAQQLLALIARDVVELAGGELFGRLRQCANPQCSLFYVDTSRAGNRRWCSMELCGARDKMTRYRARA